MLMEQGRSDRERMIVRTSLIGIFANVLLVIFKALVGFLAHSIAVVLDALNNLSDVISSVVTIVGTKLAARKPDKKHPLGHGRIEYISALIVSALVLYAGITAGVESVKKILRPEEPDYRWYTLVVISAAVVVKLLLGLYVQAVGKKVNSGALTASGKDALFDAVVSASVLGSAVLYLTTGVLLEAYVGLLITALIIKAGFEMMLDTLDEILGKRVDRAFLSEIRATINQDPEVRGAYDLILHSYGPERYIGSVHVEVSEHMTATEIDRMERRLADTVFEKHGVLLAGIGIYSACSGQDALRKKVTELVCGHEGVMQIHGFFADEAQKSITFDVILDFEIGDREACFREIVSDVQKDFPDWQINATMDIDF